MNASRVSDSAGSSASESKWKRQSEFVLSVIGYSISIGNLWRFPYLTLRNEGGIFLIPYVIFLLVCGVPLFYLEVAIGQYSGKSVLSMWQLCPLFKGLGWCMCIVSCIATIYVNMVIGWSFYYLFYSLRAELPWTTCTNWWNTPFCAMPGKNLSVISGQNDSDFGNFSSMDLLFDPDVFLRNNCSSFEQAYVCNSSHTEVNSFVVFSNRTMSPVEEFWRYNMLQLSESMGSFHEFRWQLVISYALAWIVSYFCLFRGVKSVGKVVYFTVLAPYALLLILLVRAVTLDGAADGIMYYLTPKWSNLLRFQIWSEAAIQVFYSLGPAWGGLFSLASHNRRKNNCLRDTIVISVVDFGTCILGGFVIFGMLGYLAKLQNTTVQQVFKSGPGLLFLSYPAAAAEMPLAPLWSALFFTAILTLGIDSAFGMVETLLTAVENEYAVLRRNKVLLTAIVHIVMFLCGLVLTTRAGVYWFVIIDWYHAPFTLFLVAFLECIVFCWIYNKHGRLYNNIRNMLGSAPGMYWRICWCFLTPALLFAMLGVTISEIKAPSFETAQFPTWSIVFGWCLASLSMWPVLFTAIYQLFQVKGTFWQRIVILTQPTDEWLQIEKTLISDETDDCEKFNSLDGKTVLSKGDTNGVQMTHFALEPQRD